MARNYSAESAQLELRISEAAERVRAYTRWVGEAERVRDARGAARCRSEIAVYQAEIDRLNGLHKALWAERDAQA